MNFHKMYQPLRKERTWPLNPFPIDGTLVYRCINMLLLTFYIDLYEILVKSLFYDIQFITTILFLPSVTYALIFT